MSPVHGIIKEQPQNCYSGVKECVMGSHQPSWGKGLPCAPHSKRVSAAPLSRRPYTSCGWADVNRLGPATAVLVVFSPVENDFDEMLDLWRDDESGSGEGIELASGRSRTRRLGGMRLELFRAREPPALVMLLLDLPESVFSSRPYVSCLVPLGL